MVFNGAVTPEPSATLGPDPFNLDLSIVPEAPLWLYTVSYIILWLSVAVGLVLMALFLRDRANYRAQLKLRNANTEWVDLRTVQKFRKRKFDFDDDENN